MSGRLIDLSERAVQLPDSMVVDTSILVALLLTPVQQHRNDIARIAKFLTLVAARSQQVVITPTAYGELLHASIRLRYQRELRERREEISARFGHRITSWAELYKRDPSILRAHLPELTRLRLLLVGFDFLIAKPEELGPVPSGRPFDEELIHLIGRHTLDTNDALILMEASRLGISAIVTMDRDMERALPDFDIYLWR